MIKFNIGRPLLCYGDPVPPREWPYRMPHMFFDMLAETCREIEAALQDIRVVPGQEISGKADAVREQIMELVVARLALMCTKNNPNFDSFTFNAKARGRKS